jgi:hypothetical protein
MNSVAHAARLFKQMFRRRPGRRLCDLRNRVRALLEARKKIRADTIKQSRCAFNRIRR